MLGGGVCECRFAIERPPRNDYFMHRLRDFALNERINIYLMRCAQVMVFEGRFGSVNELDSDNIYLQFAQSINYDDAARVTTPHHVNDGIGAVFLVVVGSGHARFSINVRHIEIYQLPED